MNGNTVVVGLGLSGYSAVAHLRAHAMPTTAVDTRVDPPALERVRQDYPEVDVQLGAFDPTALASAVQLVVSPGIAVAEPAIAAAAARGVPVVGDVELFARVARRPVVAITGSNGKSTVTELVGAMARAGELKVGVGGNIGTPALDLLPSPPWSEGAVRVSEVDLYVLELSSFQLETTYSLRSAVAVFLNVSADHMDRYDSVEDYVKAKIRVFNGAKTLIINRDDATVVNAVQPFKARGHRVVACTSDVPADGEYGLIHDDDGHTWLSVNEGQGPHRLMLASGLNLVGRHNWVNALAALATADALGIDRTSCLDALRIFKGLAHRCELVARRNDVMWVNDSKGTNVGATLAAIDGLSVSGPVVLIAGGDGKGADFTPLGPALRGRARAVVLLGRDGPAIGRAIDGVVPVHRVSSMREAVEVAASVAKHGDVVALSPACASWDMYPNYRVRGEEFSAEVERLDARGGTS
jgi:UDP-N-acetylmuramoylalanine--D-glutamate ligase